MTCNNQLRGLGFHKNALLRNLALVAALATVFFVAPPARSYLQQVQGNATSPANIHWDLTAFPVQWSLNADTSSAKVSGGRSVADVITASFQTWQSAPNISLSASRGADTGTTANRLDGVNLVCFVCVNDAIKDPSTLAVTLVFTADSAGQDDKHGSRSRFAGQILDADILFNPQVSFSTEAGGPPADVNDLQTVATHEIGHFLGLDHSPVVRATMYPFAPPMERTLSYDDIAGMAVLYPKATPDVAMGVISGTVRMSGGSPVFGAHVFASSTTGADPYSGLARKTPIGAITLPDGSYRITGVPADSYIIAAEPLDKPVSDGDISGFARTFGRASVQTNFTTRWY